MAACERCGSEFHPDVAGQSLCAECRPPQMETMAAPKPSRRVPVEFYLKSPTVWLIVANSLVFIATCIYSRHILDFDVESLVRLGANFGPLTLGGQPWRLLTSVFLHGGLLHIVLNMWALLNLGILGEILFGRRSYLGMYFLCGLAASIASVAWHFHVGNAGTVGVGASGAIFGIAGALLPALALQKNARLRVALKGNLTSIAIFVIYTVAYGYTNAHIDNSAHIGGLITGILLGLALPSSPGWDADHHRGRKTLVFVVASLAVAAGFVFVQRSQIGVLDYARAQAAFQRKDFGTAIRYLNSSLEHDARLVDSQYLLGVIYLQQEKNDEARQHFAEAARLAPDWSLAHSQLCIAYLRLHDVESALASCRRAVQLDAKDPDKQFNLGLAQRANGDFDDAVDSFRKAEQVRPGLFDEESMLGEALAAAGDTEEAIVHLRLALKARPGDQRTRMLLQRLLVKAGRNGEARGLAGK